jgi:endonuclease/exonuclease/phosphatase family metal-dependent hydrolase
MMSIVSYNIWFDRKNISDRIDKICNIFKNTLPDVICLQEVTGFTYLILRGNLEKLGYQSCYKDFKHFEKTTEKVGYGILILSKIPILSVNIVPFMYTSMGRYFIVAKLKGDIYVVNTHLESLSINVEVRQLQIKQLMEFMGMLPTAILTMDSNITDVGNDKFPSSEIKMVDAFVQDGSSNLKKYTYDYTTNRNIPNKYKTRLDRIYYKGSIVQKSFSLIGTEDIASSGAPPSDHYGLRLDFSIKPI